MTTIYFRNLCRVRCIYIHVWRNDKTKKPLLLEDVWHANYTCTWPEVNKGIVFFLFDINFVDSSKFRISRIRQFVNNSLTNKFCCHVLYHVKHKLKQLTKKHKISVQQRIISPQMKYVSQPVFADREIQVNSPFFVIKFRNKCTVNELYSRRLYFAYMKYHFKDKRLKWIQMQINVKLS